MQKQEWKNEALMLALLHRRRTVRFGTIGTILKTYETHPWMSTTLGKLQPEATLAVLNKVYKQVTARFFNDLWRNILNVTLISLIFQLKT